MTFFPSNPGQQGKAAEATCEYLQVTLFCTEVLVGPVRVRLGSFQHVESSPQKGFHYADD